VYQRLPFLVDYPAARWWLSRHLVSAQLWRWGTLVGRPTIDWLLSNFISKQPVTLFFPPFLSLYLQKMSPTLEVYESRSCKALKNIKVTWWWWWWWNGHTLHPFGTRERHRSRARHFTVLFIVFLSTISWLLWIDRLSIRRFFYFMLCVFVLPREWLNARVAELPWPMTHPSGNSFPPPFGSSEAFAMATPPTYRATTPMTSTDLGASKEVLPQSSPAFSNTRSSSYDRTFFHPEMHGSMIFHPLRMRSTTRGRVREIEWGVC
jgi:hypothetical protein